MPAASIRQQLQLATTVAEGLAGRLTGESLTNMYVAIAEPNSASPFVLKSTPGLRAFASANPGNVMRANKTFDEVEYSVIGQQLYTTSEAGVVTARGTVVGSQTVDMDYDGFHLVMVADNKSYIYTVATATLDEIVDGDLLPAASCAFIDQRIVFGTKDTAEFQWGDIINPGSVDALDFATAEQVPDRLRAVRAQGGDLINFGFKSIEFWRSTGVNETAFVRSSAAQTMEVGCVSRDCIALLDNGFMWLGRDKNTNGLVVYRANGYAPERVSNDTVDSFLEKVGAAELATARATAYQQGGHTYYALTIPGYCTFVYDVATKRWHRRVSGMWSQNQTPVGSWDAISPTLNGTKLIAGLSDGNLYEVTGDVNTENGNPIVREAILPPFQLGGRKFSVSEFEVMCDMGLSKPGDDVKILVNYSDDGCKTWSNARQLKLGLTGQYKTRAKGSLWGESRHRTWRIRCVGDYPFSIVDAYMEFSPGSF